jgi:hypothetical protein
MQTGMRDGGKGHMKLVRDLDSFGVEIGRVMQSEKIGCACGKSNPDIFVMQSAEDWAAKNTPGPFYVAR